MMVFSRFMECQINVSVYTQTASVHMLSSLPFTTANFGNHLFSRFIYCILKVIAFNQFLRIDQQPIIADHRLVDLIR